MPAPSHLLGSSAVRFENFELDPARGILSRNGHKLKLQPQPFRVLELLVARAPAIVTREDLGDHVWGSAVHVDLDLSLNYCIRQIRQALDDSASTPRFIETLPRQGYRFIAPVIHTEVPELTSDAAHAILPVLPENLTHLPAPAARETSSTPLRRSTVVTLSCLLAVLLVITAAALHWSHRPAASAPPAIHSLAVLPLDNLSGDPAQDYFADGMTDELITMLARNSTLSITSRTSVMQYKGAHRPLREIARQLGVDAILEGSLARSPDGSVHLNVQLIQAPADTHLWAESYDRGARDLVALPREVAQSIAARLGRAIPFPTPRFIRPEAHDAYLRGHYLWFRGKNDEAGVWFRKAIDLQPDYALGWTGLSIYYGQGVIGGELDPRESLALEEESARKAVALDDSLPEAHLALSAALFVNRWDWPAAHAEGSRALALDPRFAEAWHFRAKILAALNRQDEAIAAQRKATEIAPFERPWALAYSLVLARRYDDALAEVQQRLESNPRDPDMYWFRMLAWEGKGNEKEAADANIQALQMAGDTVAAEKVRSAFRRGGYPAILRARLTALERQAASHYVSPFDLARLHASLGERDRSLALLEEALRQRAPGLLWVETDPAFDLLHADPRYRAVLRAIGLPSPS